MPPSSPSYIQEGPEWDPDVLPIKYGGASIRWDAESYDSVVIPLIVACRQVFWDLRIETFAVSDRKLEVVIACPSVYGPDSKLLTLDDGDIEPQVVAAEFARLLNVIALEVLSEPWNYRIEFRQGQRRREFSGKLAYRAF